MRSMISAVRAWMVMARDVVDGPGQPVDGTRLHTAARELQVQHGPGGTAADDQHWQFAADHANSLLVTRCPPPH